MSLSSKIQKLERTNYSLQILQIENEQIKQKYEDLEL